MSAGSQSLKYSRLRSDLQSLVAILETDIRRAGYNAGQEGYLVGVNGQQSVDINSTHDCIVYYYNHNNSLTIEDSNKMAFALKDNTLKFKTGVNQIANEVCASVTGWISVSDAGFVKITALSFIEETSSINGVTLRSVKISLSGELVSDASYSHTVTSRVQVRNIELL
jgi:type II secretory pathway component PulJ